ncbi:hypothetical protein DFH27DRAFT_595977 [Peziza echinospora]|nr:hypothetical protein DFH27DRAFT_595977 [Peziza echinospora]
MPPTAPPPPLSQSELTYLTHSLLSIPPIRPDGRPPTQLRPIHAETSILPFCPGSARLVWADGAECVVGIKLDVTPTVTISGHPATANTPAHEIPYRSWIEVSVDVQGNRDDDALNVFLAGVVGESVFAATSTTTTTTTTSGEEEEEGDTPPPTLLTALTISPRHHWTLYIDILLLVPPPTVPSLSTTHPLTLASLTTHLALRTTLVPLKLSQGDEDPLFHDDWDLAVPLYSSTTGAAAALPPISLLLMAIGKTILLDPSKDELAVAEGVWSVSFIKNAGVFGEKGVVGGRGGTGRETVRRVVRAAGVAAGEVWEALEGLLEAERRREEEL